MESDMKSETLHVNGIGSMCAVKAEKAHTYPIDQHSGNGSRHWESTDFSISKVVQMEGDMFNYTAPCLGTSGKFRVERNSISFTGIDWKIVQSNVVISKYFDEKHIVQMGNKGDDCASLIGKFRIGQGDTDIDRALEDVLKTMYPGEKSEVAVRMKLNMGKRQHLSKLIDVAGSVDHWITFQLTCTLLDGESYQEVPSLYNWHPIQKLKEAKINYESAVKLFHDSRYLDSFVFFRQALALCYFAISQKNTNNSRDVQEDEANVLKEKCISNITACHFQWSNYQHVINLANERLNAEAKGETSVESFGKNLKVKMLYRRGVAYAEMNEYDKAIRDLNDVVIMEPNNKAALQKLQTVRDNHQRADMNLRTAMKKMFQSAPQPNS